MENNEKLKAACDSAEQNMDSLSRRMDDFCTVFTEDRECWRGEAASEERSFVSSDRKYLDELLRNMKALIRDAKASREK